MSIGWPRVTSATGTADEMIPGHVIDHFTRDRVLPRQVCDVCHDVSSPGLTKSHFLDSKLC